MKRLLRSLFLWSALASVASGQTAKLSDLSAILDTSVATGDLLYLVDIDAGVSGSKSITVNELGQALFTSRLFRSELSDTSGTEIITNPTVNSIAAGNHNSIIGGGYSTRPNLITGDADLRFIYGGYENEVGPVIAGAIISSYHSGIADADGNTSVPGARTVITTSGHSWVFGGAKNMIDYPQFNCIVGGDTNVLTEGNFGCIVSSQSCTMDAAAGFMGSANNITMSEAVDDTNQRLCAITSTNFTMSDGIYTTAIGAFNENGGVSTTAMTDCDYASIIGIRDVNLNACNFAFVSAGEDHDIDNGSYKTILSSRQVTDSSADAMTLTVGSYKGSITAGHSQLNIGTTVWAYNDTAFTQSGGAMNAGDTPGDCQTQRLVMRREVTGDTLTRLAYSTSWSDSDNVSGALIFPDSDRAYFVTADVVGRKTDGTEAASWKISGLVNRNGGVSTLVGENGNGAPLISDAGAATWQCECTLVSGRLDIECAGDAGDTVWFVASVTITEVGEP